MIHKMCKCKKKELCGIVDYAGYGMFGTVFGGKFLWCGFCRKGFVKAAKLPNDLRSEYSRYKFTTKVEVGKRIILDIEGLQ
jgi:hypothetical protein